MDHLACANCAHCLHWSSLLASVSERRWARCVAKRAGANSLDAAAERVGAVKKLSRAAARARRALTRSPARVPRWNRRAGGGAPSPRAAGWAPRWRRRPRGRTPAQRRRRPVPLAGIARAGAGARAAGSSTRLPRLVSAPRAFLARQPRKAPAIHVPYPAPPALAHLQVSGTRVPCGRTEDLPRTTTTKKKDLSQKLEPKFGDYNKNWESH